jgi:hypothetical protein
VKSITANPRTTIRPSRYLLLPALGILLLAGALLLWALGGGSSPAGPLEAPETLAGQTRTQLLSGEEAVASIDRLHGRQIPQAEALVAAYGQGRVVLWVTAAADEEEAARLTALMVERIAEGRSPYRENGIRLMDAVTIYDLIGHGQRHFYWQTGRLVVWVAADEDLADQALREALDYYK